MTRWLLTGAGGMLGRDVVGVLRARPGTVVTAAGREEPDITDGLPSRRWADAGLPPMGDWRAQLRAAMRRPAFTKTAEAAVAAPAIEDQSA